MTTVRRALYDNKLRPIATDALCAVGFSAGESFDKHTQNFDRQKIYVCAQICCRRFRKIVGIGTIFSSVDDSVSGFLDKFLSSFQARIQVSLMHSPGAVICWAPVLAPWSDRMLEKVERIVPASQFKAAMRFRSWEDRQARLLGRLALFEILQSQHIIRSLNEIEFTLAGRPIIPGSGEFSIAHTTKLALCAWVSKGHVGIDAEALQPDLPVNDVLPFMSDGERAKIASSPDPAEQALSLWVAKEAVCKAVGCGITSEELPDCSSPYVNFRGTLWSVRLVRRRSHIFAFARTACESPDWRSFRLRLEAPNFMDHQSA